MAAYLHGTWFEIHSAAILRQQAYPEICFGDIWAVVFACVSVFEEIDTVICACQLPKLTKE